MPTTYISNSAHYKEVISRVQSVKHTLWIDKDFCPAPIAYFYRKQHFSLTSATSWQRSLFSLHRN
jgi:hypothetical protein